MNPFYIVLIAVLTLTILSGGTAGLLVALGAGRTQVQKSVIEKLIHIALLGAGAVIALLGRFQSP